uniref:Uncharacterized protein n=1 Tax=Rangifer tarandus platyrhynchus TaxID=3082113 RepID=A0ACB0EZE3_RANTA|nr:unnamed protein product [Rangifer tarandus platyrhynchus]
MSQPMKKMFENSQVPGCGLLQLGSGQASAQSRGDRSPAAIIRSHGHPPPSTSSRTRSFPPCSQVHFTSRTGCCRDTRRLGSRLAPPSPTRGPGKSLSDSVPLRSLLQSGHSSPNALLIELDQVCDPMFTVETRLLIHVASAPAECSQNQDPGPHRTSQCLEHQTQPGVLLWVQLWRWRAAGLPGGGFIEDRSRALAGTPGQCTSCTRLASPRKQRSCSSGSLHGHVVGVAGPSLLWFQLCWHDPHPHALSFSVTRKQVKLRHLDSKNTKKASLRWPDLTPGVMHSKFCVFPARTPGSPTRSAAPPRSPTALGDSADVQAGQTAVGAAAACTSAPRCTSLQGERTGERLVAASRDGFPAHSLFSGDQRRLGNCAQERAEP